MKNNTKMAAGFQITLGLGW